VLREVSAATDDDAVMKTSLRALAVLVVSLFFATRLQAAAPEHWVGSWATADLDRPNLTPKNGDMVFGAADTTLRQIVHLSLGGAMVRVELSNRFGTEPLQVGAAHVALGTKGEIQLPTANALTFGGRASVMIPAGADVVSDPVAMAVPQFADVTISIFLPAQKISHLTVHNSAYATEYVAAGNVVSEKTLPADAKTMTSFFFLKAVDVKAAAGDGAVVAFGDSITDGTASTTDANKRWPDFLARRLGADKKTAGLGVLNMGIGGNRVLHDGTGPSALARFDEDVLAQSGVKYMIVLESINDIGHAYDPNKPYDVVTTADLIQGLTQLVERAHMHGIKVFGATLTPYAGAKYMSPAGEEVRKAVNQWIRTGNVFDGVIDFEKATMDPATGAFKAEYDRGDHLHPTDAGMEAMAGAIDLRMFGR
jgi:lysophospholipase L1-like esterase